MYIELISGLGLMIVASIWMGAVLGMRIDRSRDNKETWNTSALVYIAIAFLFYWGALLVEPAAVTRNTSTTQYALKTLIFGGVFTAITGFLWYVFFFIRSGRPFSKNFGRVLMRGLKSIE